MTWVGTRRVTLVVLVVGALLWLGAGGLPEVCSEELSTVSGKPVPVCEPLTIADPRVLLFLLLIGGLLLPEVAELEVPGVLTVRRHVDEAKAEVAGLKSELGQIRTEILNAASAAAHSHSRASVENHIYPDRSADVRRAYQEADGGGDGDFDESEERGAYAAVAFEAGFYGLLRYLPDDLEPAIVAGYRFNEVGDLELDLLAGRGERDEYLEGAQLEAVPPPISGIFYDRTAGSATFSAPACDEKGLVVGALVVRVGNNPDFLDISDREDTIGAVALMASAYARLLIDLIDERPRQPDDGNAAKEGTE